MNPKQFLTAAFVLAACVYGGAAMPDSFDDSLLLNGRWAKADSCLCASAPAVSVSFRANAKEVSFDIEGEARFRLDTDGKPGEYFTILGRTVQKVALAKDGREHLYRLVKVSESNPGKICLHGIALGKGGSFGKRPEPSRRRIEFIGDSFTVGYGVEANGPEDGTPFEKTNTAKAYSFLLADGFKADYQINAVSGRGLVRNYANIVPEWTLASLYEYTVPGSIEQEAGGADQGPKTAGIRWDFEQFHPQVVVVFVGINDFQGEPPYADAVQFKRAYAALLDKLRSLHPGVKFLLVSTKTWPNDALTPVVEEIYKDQLAAGHADLLYRLVYTENTALHGHPSEMSQKMLANDLRPLVARLGGWLSR